MEYANKWGIMYMRQIQQNQIFPCNSSGVKLRFDEEWQGISWWLPWQYHRLMQWNFLPGILWLSFSVTACYRWRAIHQSEWIYKCRMEQRWFLHALNLSRGCGHCVQHPGKGQQSAYVYTQGDNRAWAGSFLLTVGCQGVNNLCHPQYM